MPKNCSEVFESSVIIQEMKIYANVNFLVIKWGKMLIIIGTVNMSILMSIKFFCQFENHSWLPLADCYNKQGRNF